MQIFERYGLQPLDQQYSANGRNIIAEKEGTMFPDEKYMICAHYDTVADHCADDNASGTAIVMEAARILHNYEFPYTIVYALWDQEEIGLIGSSYYAQQAASNNDQILGVLNA